MGLQTAFYMVVLGAQTMALGFQGAFEAIVNAGIWMYNQIVGLLNKLGGSFSTLDYADFTSGTVDAISKTMGDYASSIAETYGEMTDVSNQINDISTKMQQTAYDQASNIQNMAGEFNATRDQRVQDRTKLSISGITSGIKDGIAGLGSSLTGSMDDLVSGISAPDSSGSRAIKTTTNDDLISDEDIQLLLDVATRDYKLNYQQVTPEITLTFGDIRETADVDSILDEVATKLEEIYDGNLEVS